MAVSINKETTPKIHSKIAEDAFNNIVESALKEDKIINKEATTKEKEVKALGLREQEEMLYDGNLETVVSNRKEHGLAIPTAVEDYEKYSGNAFSETQQDFDNTNVQTVLQALGFVSPYGIYINKNDADKDRYQKEYDTNIDFVKKEIIIRDIVEQKDLLLSESLTKLIDKRKKLGLDNELTKRIEEIKEMKEKASDNLGR